MCAVYIGSNPHPTEPSATDWAQLVDQTRCSNHLATEVINMADRHWNLGIATKPGRAMGNKQNLTNNLQDQEYRRNRN